MLLPLGACRSLCSFLWSTPIEATKHYNYNQTDYPPYLAALLLCCVLAVCLLSFGLPHQSHQALQSDMLITLIMLQSN
jgi:hypothetical protein